MLRIKFPVEGKQLKASADAGTYVTSDTFRKLPLESVT